MCPTPKRKHKMLTLRIASSTWTLSRLGLFAFSSRSAATAPSSLSLRSSLELVLRTNFSVNVPDSSPSSPAPSPSLPSHTRVVIIGGGVIGCSVAYHMGLQGWGKVSEDF